MAGQKWTPSASRPLTKLSSPRGSERLAVQQNFLHRPWLFRCDRPSSRRGQCRSRLCTAKLYELNKIVNHVPGIEKRQASFSYRFFGSAIEARGKSPGREWLPQLSKRAEDDAAWAHIVQQSDRAARLHDTTELPKRWHLAWLSSGSTQSKKVATAASND